MVRALIVDDHAGFRRQARALLEADGFDVVGEACNSADALDAAADLDPDVVLLDVQLPDVDGFAVARGLHALSRRIVVVLTSSRDRSDYGPLVTECAGTRVRRQGRAAGH